MLCAAFVRSLVPDEVVSVTLIQAVNSYLYVLLRAVNECQLPNTVVFTRLTEQKVDKRLIC